MKTNVQVVWLGQYHKGIQRGFIASMLILFSAMAFSQSVVDIIVNSENHTTLEAAVIAAELADDLAGEGPFTVFAPTDDAFSALPEGTVESLLEDPTGQLAQILLYHVAGANAMSTDLSDGQMVTTLEGSDVTVAIMDSKVYINGAMVTLADIEAYNGVVHVIDAVILPSTNIEDKKLREAGLTIFPNPASEYVNVSFELIEPSPVTFSIYDFTGKQVTYIQEGYLSIGKHNTEIPLSGLQTGSYIIHTSTSKDQISRKIRVVK